MVIMVVIFMVLVSVDRLVVVIYNYGGGTLLPLTSSLSSFGCCRHGRCSKFPNPADWWCIFCLWRLVLVVEC